MKIRRGRVGLFLLIVGVLLLLLFFALDSSQGLQVEVFFVGVFLAGLGVILIWRDWKPAAPSSDRFHSIRLIQEKREERKKAMLEKAKNPAAPKKK